MIQRIWSQDPPYDLEASSGRCVSRTPSFPSSASALCRNLTPNPARRSRCRSSSRNSPTARVAAKRGCGIISANNVPINALGSHWQIYAKACAEAGMPARGENWRVARNVMVAPSDGRSARPGLCSEQARTVISTLICARCCRALGSLSALKPRAGHVRRGSDRRCHHRRLCDLRLAQNAARQAYRLPRRGRPVWHSAGDRPGLERPQCGLGADSMRLLAQEVMPKLRQHAMAQAV